MKQKKHHPVQDLEPEDIQCLGECVHDLVARLGYGSHTEPLEAMLFREAIDAAVWSLRRIGTKRWKRKLA